MRWKAVLLAGSIAPLAGCIMGENGARNLINEPGQFLDDKRIRHESFTEAQRIWSSICQQHPPGTFSKDYEKGFISGYTDYLDNGGPGIPPAIPPREYRRSGYLNPEGHARTRDWFAGFQYGIDVAKDSGKRGYLTVPVLLPETQASEPLKVKQIPREAASGDVIPKPKPVDTGTGLPTPMRPTLSSLSTPRSAGASPTATTVACTGTCRTTRTGRSDCRHTFFPTCAASPNHETSRRPTQRSRSASADRNSGSMWAGACSRPAARR